MGKHQSACYRIIKGRKFENFCDLIYGKKKNQEAIDEAKKIYKYVRKAKHSSGNYYQLFVSNELIEQ